jgi:DNA-binding transcriptional LysR family regulator
LLPQVHALEQEVAAAVRVTEGTLAIAAGSYPGYMLVPNTIAAMSHNVADLSVRYHEASWMNFCSLLTNREVDVAVGDIGGLREDPRLQTERLDEDLLYYFCRSGHPLSGHQGVSLQDIRAFPLAGNSAPPHIARLLGRDQRTGTRDEVTGLFHPRFTLTTLAAVKRIVGSTDAISLAPLSLLEADLRSGALAVIHCAGAQPSLNTGIVHLAGRALNPVAAAFVRELKHQSSSMRACSARLKKQLGLTPQGG